MSLYFYGVCQTMPLRVASSGIAVVICNVETWYPGTFGLIPHVGIVHTWNTATYFAATVTDIVCVWIHQRRNLPTSRAWSRTEYARLSLLQLRSAEIRSEHLCNWANKPNKLSLCSKLDHQDDVSNCLSKFNGLNHWSNVLEGPSRGLHCISPIPCSPISVFAYSVFAYSVFAYSVFAYSVFAYSMFAFSVFTYPVLAYSVLAYSLTFPFLPIPCSPIPYSPIPYSPIPYPPIPCSPIPYSPIPYSPIPYLPIPCSPIPCSPIPYSPSYYYNNLFVWEPIHRRYFVSHFKFVMCCLHTCESRDSSPR